MATQSNPEECHLFMVTGPRSSLDRIMQIAQEVPTEAVLRLVCEPEDEYIVLGMDMAKNKHRIGDDEYLYSYVAGRAVAEAARAKDLAAEGVASR